MTRGERIRKRREELGISQSELARLLGKTRSLVSFAEKTGKVNDLTYYDALRILELTPETEDEQFLVKRFQHFDEPIAGYSTVNKELEFLRRENETLRELVNLQKSVIEMLRKAVR